VFIASPGLDGGFVFNCAQLSRQHALKNPHCRRMALGMGGETALDLKRR
jgi:hypothetical protein